MQRAELNEANGWTVTVTGLPAEQNGAPVAYAWTEQEVPGYKQIGTATNGTVTTITNQMIKVAKVPEDQPQPKVPLEKWYVFDEYETALGIPVLMNHAGDCFD